MFPSDHARLADVILRRCEGLPVGVVLGIARRFLDATGAAAQDRLRVVSLLQARLGPVEVVNGSVVCSVCGKNYYAHVQDSDVVEVCGGGRKVRVV